MCLEMEQDLLHILGVLIADAAGKHHGPVVLLNGGDRSEDVDVLDDVLIIIIIVVVVVVVVVELLELLECVCVVVTYISITETILQNIDRQRLCEPKLLLKDCKIILSSLNT